jgi:tRNA-uridine aminocarboxypropyltransferase
MQTRTRVVLLMHPKEYRHQKCTTGRLLCLHLENSEIIPGVCFEHNDRVRQLMHDPGNYPVLVYPGKDALSVRDIPAAALHGRRLVVFLVDGTWHCARTIIRESPLLLRLPRLMIQPVMPSRFTIKRQPASWCLSTLEAAHELLLGLEAGGLDVYPDKGRLLAAFEAMQDFQILQISRAASRPDHRVRGIRLPRVP